MHKTVDPIGKWVRAQKSGFQLICRPSAAQLDQRNPDLCAKLSSTFRYVGRLFYHAIYKKPRLCYKLSQGWLTPVGTLINNKCFTSPKKSSRSGESLGVDMVIYSRPGPDLTDCEY
jgi:hypothetical protein